MPNSAVDVSASTGTPPFFREITGFDSHPWQCKLREALRNGHPPPVLDIPAGLAKHWCTHAAGQPGLHTATPTLAPGWGEAMCAQENPALSARPGHIGGRATSI